MRLATTSLFVAILINPLPGGGKIPAIGQAESVHLAQFDVLAIVLIVSFVQIALLMYGVNLLASLAARLPRRMRKSRANRALPDVAHPVLRYATIAAFPLFPAGGGMYWAIGFSQAWKLDRNLSIALISVANWLSFVSLYLLAGTFGLLPFLVGFVSVIAIWFLARWSTRKLRTYRHAHA